MHRHVLLFVSALAAATLLGCPEPDPDAVAFQVTADTGADFGSVLVGAQSAEKTFTVTNVIGGTSGKLVITLEGGAAAAFRLGTDGCSGTTLADGATCSVGVLMSPLSGGAKTALLVARDSHGKGQTNVVGTGTTRALLQVSPASFGFGLVPTGGTSADATLTVSNGGTEPTGTLEVTLGGAGANQFTKPADACDGQALAAGGSCTIKVRFAPSGLGAQVASVTITGTPGGTLTIPLGGTGGTPAALAINPTSKDFGTVAVPTQTADTTFTVTNTGAVNATTLTVALTGNTGEFVNRGGTCSGLASLAPAVGGTPNCTVIVAFKPTAFGTKNLTVTVNGRVASSSATTSVSVSPTGVGSQTFTVTVANSGTGSGTVTGGTINCGSACTAQVTAAATPGSITLTAAAAAGSSFAGWTGDCAPSNPNTSCTLTVDANKNAGAAFDIQRFSLTPVVNASPGAGGSVTSSDGLINCTGASCAPVSYDYNTVVHLTAATAPGSRFTGWGGDCTGSLGTTCDVTMTQARAATANFLPSGNYAFVTSTTYSLSELALRGDPGGALNAGNVTAGADVACNERAAAAGLPGNYKAWIASSLGTAQSRLGLARGWLRTDGLPFANTLPPGDLHYPLQRDENGAVAALGADVLTNALSTTGEALGSCSDFTVNTGTTAEAGNPSGASTIWSSWTATADCAGSFRLFCLGTDNNAPVPSPAPPTGARLLFVTNGAFLPGSGIAAAHALCQSEATVASLPGTYKALLATTGASAASLFTPRGVAVVRPDGVQVASTDANLFADPQVLMAPPERLARGTVAFIGSLWTGADSATNPGTDASTCTNWTSTAGSGGTGVDSTADFMFAGTTGPCAAPAGFFCLQE